MQEVSCHRFRWHMHMKVREKTFVLFRVICGVREDPREEMTNNPVGAFNLHSVDIGFHELFV